jgi:hypothetical protein
MGYTQPRPALPTMSGAWWAMELCEAFAQL